MTVRTERQKEREKERGEESEKERGRRRERVGARGEESQARSSRHDGGGPTTEQSVHHSTRPSLCSPLCGSCGFDCNCIALHIFIMPQGRVIVGDLQYAMLDNFYAKIINCRFVLLTLLAHRAHTTATRPRAADASQPSQTAGQSDRALYTIYEYDMHIKVTTLSDRYSSCNC